LVTHYFFTWYSLVPGFASWISPGSTSCRLSNYGSRMRPELQGNLARLAPVKPSFTPGWCSMFDPPASVCDPQGLQNYLSVPKNETPQLHSKPLGLTVVFHVSMVSFWGYHESLHGSNEGLPCS
jgi:hypothetical protein